MKVLKKKTGQDFVVLNLTDPQLGDPEWAEGSLDRRVLEYTVEELVKRVKPDLITISGDLGWAEYTLAYDLFAELLEKFQIPWAPIWGNHDNQNGAEHVAFIVNRYRKYSHFLYEEGDPAMGNGNYVIAIEEEGKVVEGLIMMDSHNRVDYVDDKGEVKQVDAKLLPLQMDWYRAQIHALKERGCNSATMVLHIPPYAFREASKAAYQDGLDLTKTTLQEADGTACWKEGYEDSVGVQHEGICSYPEEDGVLAVIKEEGVTKRIVAGHDHVNNWMITYEGIQMIYALKTGAGCYWNPLLNGGTTLKVGSEGVYEVKHEYVDASHLLG
jgi:hypothetical protein